MRTGTSITVTCKVGKGPKPFRSIASYLHWLKGHDEVWENNIAHVTLVTDSVSLEARLGFFKIRGVKGATAQNNGTRLIVDVRRPRTLARAFNIAVRPYSPDGGGGPNGDDGEPFAIVRSLQHGGFDRHLYLVRSGDAPA